MPHKLAFVVPTKDRPDDLTRLLESVREQSIRPDQLIIVDGSDEPIDHVVKKFNDLDIDYVRVYPPGLAKQRNAGMAQLRDDITLAGYLDDDIVLLDGALKAMMEFWDETDDHVGGARFNIVDEGGYEWLRSFPLILLGLRSREPGQVLRSGFETPIGTVDRTLEVDWLSGGATIWRRKVVESIEYDEWFQGTGYLEDVDYSYRVRSAWRLAVVSGAHVLHLSRPMKPESYYSLGYQQMVNRWYFVNKHEGLTPWRFAWAACSLTILTGILAMAKREATLNSRFKGHVRGLLDLVRGSSRQDDAILK